MALDPDHIPPRWIKPTPSGRATHANRWIAAKPERLLAWWLLLASCIAVGVVLTALAVLPWGVVLVVVGVLNLLPDARYIPRVLTAWRHGE